MNAMAYADIEPADSSMATSIASTCQQLSLSFGLACGSLIAGWYLGNLPQTDQTAVTTALHYTFLSVGGLTILFALHYGIYEMAPELVACAIAAGYPSGWLRR